MKKSISTLYCIAYLKKSVGEFVGTYFETFSIILSTFNLN